MIFPRSAPTSGASGGCSAWRARINVARLMVMAALTAGLMAGGADADEKVITLLVIGDSLTAGYGLARADGFPAQLERALARQGLAVQVRDGGVSGETTAGGRARLAWMLGDAPAQQPDAVILQLGGNDALRGIDPSVTYANLSAMLSELKARGIPVLLAGMRAPPNLGEPYRQRFDSIYPRLAAEHGVPLYPFFLDGVAAVPALNQPDGIHPNPQGVAEIVRRITPQASSLVGAATRGVPAHSTP